MRRGFGKEPQDLAHQPLPLVGFENVLSVRGALEDHQLFRIGGPLKLVANLRESKDAITAEVVASRDEQLSALHPLGFIDRRSGEQHDSIDLARRGLDRGLGRSPASEAAANDRNGLRADLQLSPLLFRLHRPEAVHHDSRRFQW